MITDESHTGSFNPGRFVHVEEPPLQFAVFIEYVWARGEVRCTEYKTENGPETVVRELPSGILGVSALEISMAGEGFGN
jgi:hypothetical protein